MPAAAPQLSTPLSADGHGDRVLLGAVDDVEAARLPVHLPRDAGPSKGAAS